MSHPGIVACASLCVASAAVAEVAVTDGLQYHLDSTVAGTVLTNEDGRVYEWRSTMSSHAFKSSNDDRPYFAAGALGGKDAVRFCPTDENSARNYLKLSSVTTNQTIIYVIKQTSAAGCGEIFGPFGIDCGIRVKDTHGQHYVDSLNDGGWVYVNGVEALNPDSKKLPSAQQVYPAADSPLNWEVQVCVEVRPDDATKTFISGSNKLGTIFNVTGLGSFEGNGYWSPLQRYLRGYCTEVLVYDRKLTDNERNYLTASLLAKWRPDDVCTWTGGGTTAWSDPDNWRGGRVPDAASVVFLKSQTLTVSGTIVANMLVLEDTALTLADGAELVVSSLCQLPGDMSSFTLAGDAIVQTTVDTVISGRFAGTGRLVKKGAATLRFAADGALDGVALDIREGRVDLQGTTQSVSGIAGRETQVVNSSANPATLTVTVAEGRTVVMEPEILGTVRLVKRGTGTLVQKAFQDYAGETVLEGGTLSASAAVVSPKKIPGLVMRIDASHPETLVTNADGRVSKWFSLTDPVGGSVRHFVRNEVDQQPIYRPEALGGKGAVAFGVAPDGSVTNTSLSGSASITNGTVFIVNVPAAQQSAGLPGIYGQYGWDSGIRITGSKKDRWDAATLPTFVSSKGRVLLDGQVAFDPQAGLTGDVVYTPDQIQLLTAVIDVEAKAVEGETSHHLVDFTPLLGQYFTTYPRFFTGLVAELLVYDRMLTSNEVAAVQADLMTKWGITPAEPQIVRDSLSPTSSLVVRQPATVDCAATPQSQISEIVLDAGGTDAYPLLSVNGLWDISAMRLCLTNAAGSVALQDLMRNDEGAFSGRFADVVAPQGTPAVSCHSHSIKFAGGLMILFR